MNQRGRKGVSQLETLSPLDATVRDLTVDQRLEAPLTMTDAERGVWYQVINDLPAMFFSPTHIPLLTMYCRHVVQASVINEQILAFDEAWFNEPGGVGRYDLLLRMHQRETAAASSIATKLRITKQSLDPKTAGRQFAKGPSVKKPWESN